MNYFQKIDGLRFLAIATVMVHHIASIFSTYIDLGYFGVDLFFVISGFLITAILLKTEGNFRSSYTRFLARRSLRIFPLYYLVLLILYIIGDPIVHQEITYLVSYTFNYRFPSIETPNPVGHFWSLAVEEQYYLFWPFVVLGLRKNSKILIGFTIVMISFAYLQIYWNLIPDFSKFNYTGLPTRMGSLGLGSLGAMLYIRPRGWLEFILQNKSIERIALFLWAFSLLWFSPFLMGLMSLFFVMKAADNRIYLKPLNYLLSHRYALYLSKISYGLYIYHVVIIFYLTPYVFDPIWRNIDFSSFGKLSIIQYHSWIFKLPVYTGITILIADLSYRYFEKPLLRLKNIYFNYTN